MIAPWSYGHKFKVNSSLKRDYQLRCYNKFMLCHHFLSSNPQQWEIKYKKNKEKRVDWAQEEDNPLSLLKQSRKVKTVFAIKAVRLLVTGLESGIDGYKCISLRLGDKICFISGSLKAEIWAYASLRFSRRNNKV